MKAFFILNYVPLPFFILDLNLTDTQHHSLSPKAMQVCWMWFKAYWNHPTISSIVCLLCTSTWIFFSWNFRFVLWGLTFSSELFSLSLHCVCWSFITGVFPDKLHLAFFLRTAHQRVSSAAAARAGWLILSTYTTSPTKWIMSSTGQCKYKCHRLTNLCFDSSTR